MGLRQDSQDALPSAPMLSPDPSPEPGMHKSTMFSTTIRSSQSDVDGTSPRSYYQRMPSTDRKAEHLGIYLTSPVTMVVAYLLGAGFAIGLHGYYSHLNRTVVGEIAEQQLALRYFKLLSRHLQGVARSSSHDL